MADTVQKQLYHTKNNYFLWYCKNLNMQIMYDGEYKETHIHS